MDSGLFFHLEIEKNQSVKMKEIYGNRGLSSSRELLILTLVSLGILRPPF